MARQNTAPVQFNRTSRQDIDVSMSSGRAGLVIPVDYVPLLRGDSASGRVAVDIKLAEMPRPLLNGVMLNVQAWFVAKSVHPRFSGYDEFMHSYQGENIKQLGSADRTPPGFFHVLDGVNLTTAKTSLFLKTLGIHIPAGVKMNTDLLDAFWLVYNFRLASHSSKLALQPLAQENLAAALDLPPAFWPSSRFSQVVSDYERALIVGSFDLDVLAGQMPVSGISKIGAGTGYGDGQAEVNQSATAFTVKDSANRGASFALSDQGISSIFAEMAGQKVNVTLADMDIARTTQAFAKLRTAYDGNKHSAHMNDDAIIAELMQGMRVPEEMFRRPWLLDSKRVPFGMVERHASDGANLDKSTSEGVASATLSLNVPSQDTGGVIIVTCEVLPERLDERQTDEWLLLEATDQFPNALRDVQRVEPVDIVQKRRIDAAHTDPSGAYGFEPMNHVWQRSKTRLGGSFFQDDPANPFVEQREAIWLASIVDPSFTNEHFLAPKPFPHNVFADSLASAFEIVTRHDVSISGLTQFGDVLAESNDDYSAVQSEGIIE